VSDDFYALQGPRCIERHELVRAVYGDDDADHVNVTHMMIHLLRQKLKPAGWFVLKYGPTEEHDMIIGLAELRG
jgi:hypothetical protein